MWSLNIPQVSLGFLVHLLLHVRRLMHTTLGSLRDELKDFERDFNAYFLTFSLHRQTSIMRRLHQSSLHSVSRDSLIYKWDSPEPFLSPVPPPNMDSLMEVTKSRQWKRYSNNDKVRHNKTDFILDTASCLHHSPTSTFPFLRL